MPFWPAKVMRVLNGECDVRFFGGFHQVILIAALIFDGKKRLQTCFFCFSESFGGKISNEGHWYKVRNNWVILQTGTWLKMFWCDLFSPQTLQIKRTSLWNKANAELKKHQHLLEKVKEKKEDFFKEPYGDPFASDEMREILGKSIFLSFPLEHS